MIGQHPYSVPAIVCDADKLSQVAIIQELGRLRIPVTALAQSPRALGFASKYARPVVCPVPSHDPGYIAFLLRETPRGVLFYSNDANTENISRHAAALRAGGFSLFISDPSTLERVIQKDLLCRAACECGVAVPRCSPVASAAALEAKIAEYGLPLILKSTNLAGGIYQFVPSAAAAPAVFHQMMERIQSQALRHRDARLMAQQWIPQEGVRLWNFNASVQGGEIISFSMGQRLRTDVREDGTLGSTLLYGRTAFHPEIFEQNRRILAHLKFDGLVETEWSESGAAGAPHYLYDFNPRPSGNIRWTFKSGVSLADDYYRLALGLAPHPQTMRPGTLYAKLIYRNNDALESLGNPRLSSSSKARIVGQDLYVLAACRRHAVDVLDFRDLGPTFRAAGEAVPLFAAALRCAAHRMIPAFGRWHPAKCASE